MSEVLDATVSALKASRRHRFLCEDTLRRVARWAAARHSKRRDIVKAARRKLRQVWGAYLDGFDAAEVDRLVAALPGNPPDDVLRETCLRVLASHASTRERVPFMAEAYAAVFERAGRPRVVLDLACGLNPFALPWMGLPEGVRYHACDIDARVVSAANAFLGGLGVEHHVACADLLVSVPRVRADVAFLLKTLPCLERQEKGSGLRVLREVDARVLVISFPARSLGGREKGMREHYRGEMARLLTSGAFNGRRWQAVGACPTTQKSAGRASLSPAAHVRRPASNGPARQAGRAGVPEKRTVGVRDPIGETGGGRLLGGTGGPEIAFPTETFYILEKT